MPHPLRRLPLLLLVAACAAPEAEPEAEVGRTSAALFSGTGSVAAEATIFEDAQGNNAGGYADFCVGNLATTATTRRAFVRYDLPSIPAGATVTRVRLEFSQDRVRFMGTGPKAATLRIRRALGAWSEGSGTSGLPRSCGGGTNVAGIDWANAPSFSSFVSGAESLPSTNGIDPRAIAFDTASGTDDDRLVDDVQAWVDGATNHGWWLRVLEEGTIDNARSLDPGTLTVWWTKANGGSCDFDNDCNSGSCVHGDGSNCGGRAGCVCCNAATCAGDCESCHLAGSVGTCSPRSSSVVCRGPSCAAGVASLQTTCDGVSGSCPSAPQQDCTPYFCDGNACGTSCTDNGDCENTFFCDGSNQCATISNECVAELDDCVALATCEDPSVALGDWTCTCPAGYAGDGRSPGTGCTELNECALGTDDCDGNATCTNTPPGSFTCTCNGPEWVGDGKTCVDYDECTDPFYTAMCDANADCVNRVPGFDCVCDAGYEGNGFSCAEIDECAEGLDDCDPDATCTNEPGSFSCTCNAGYAGDGKSCADVDECADPLFVATCSANATCNNLPGSAECVCDDGYAGDGETCENVDECAEGLDNCDPNAICTDMEGTFLCTCAEHYFGTGIFCSDVDECADGTGDCATDEMCVNVVGGPNECVCRPGFTREDPEDAGSECIRSCGDGVRGVGEECDDGNGDVGDGCNEDCLVERGWDCFEPAGELSECIDVCPNGIVNASEECDDGDANSDSEPDACRTDCALPSCGDGVVDSGEDCDAGDANDDEAAGACRTTCVEAYCGDGIVDPGERCDPGGFEPGAAPADICAAACEPDAGPPPALDLGVPDAGFPGGPTGGSSGCRVAGPDRRPLAPWGFALLGAAIALRRRRR